MRLRWLIAVPVLYGTVAIIGGIGFNVWSSLP
jgi:hypothetical protein